MSNSLCSLGLQHSRLPCPSPSPGVCSNSCSWIGDAIQPSHPVLCPNSCLQSFSAYLGPNFPFPSGYSSCLDFDPPWWHHVYLIPSVRALLPSSLTLSGTRVRMLTREFVAETIQPIIDLGFLFPLVQKSLPDSRLVNSRHFPGYFKSVRTWQSMLPTDSRSCGWRCKMQEGLWVCFPTTVRDVCLLTAGGSPR